MFARLRGMFTRRGLRPARATVCCSARDRFGIKPLFYARDATASSRSRARSPRSESSPASTSRLTRRRSRTSRRCSTSRPRRRSIEGSERSEPGDAARLHASSATAGSSSRPALPLVRRSRRRRARARGGRRRSVGDARREGVAQSARERRAARRRCSRGGIDSSLVSAFAQRPRPATCARSASGMPDPSYDETWAAEAVAARIGSQPPDARDRAAAAAAWDDDHDAPAARGPAVRRHVDVRASTRSVARCASTSPSRSRATAATRGSAATTRTGSSTPSTACSGCPRSVWRWPARPCLDPLRRFDLVRPASAAARLRLRRRATTSSVVQALFSWIRPREHERELLADPARRRARPRRLFERRSGRMHTARRHRRLERLSARSRSRLNVRLVLPNDFLFKVDTASMRHSLEVRVPLLDEELMDFGLALPHAPPGRGPRGQARPPRRSPRRHLPRR